MEPLIGILVSGIILAMLLSIDQKHPEPTNTQITIDGKGYSCNPLSHPETPSK